MTGPFATRHDAIVYDDDIHVADRITALIHLASQQGGHTLLTLPPAVHQCVRSRMQAGIGPVELRDMNEHTQRPIDAVERLWQFTRTGIDRGATRILAIAGLQLTDAARAPAWLWYEAAVLEVLKPLPIHLVCLIDQRITARRHLRQLTDTHRANQPIPPMPRIALPAAPASRTIHTSRAADARRAIRDVADHYGTAVAEDASLVVSELVTDAVNHARTSARIEIWTEPHTLTFTVTDHGPGFADHAATLRPPDLPVRGAGLWLCHQLSHRFSVHSTGTGCEARAQFLRSTPRTPPWHAIPGGFS